MLLQECKDTWKAHLVVVYSFLEMPIFNYKAFQMQTGLVAKKPEGPSQVNVSSWANHSFHGGLRNNWLCSKKKKLTVSKSSSEAEFRALQLLHMNFNGFYMSFRIYKSNVPKLQSYIVIIKLPFILLQILCFMSVLNTWRLIAILYAKSFKPMFSKCCLSHQRNKLLISSPKHFFHSLSTTYCPSWRW